jgi:hypothetical protein
MEKAGIRFPRFRAFAAQLRRELNANRPGSDPRLAPRPGPVLALYSVGCPAVSRDAAPRSAGRRILLAESTLFTKWRGPPALAGASLLIRAVRAPAIPCRAALGKQWHLIT